MKLRYESEADVLTHVESRRWSADCVGPDRRTLSSGLDERVNSAKSRTALLHALCAT